MLQSYHFWFKLNSTDEIQNLEGCFFFKAMFDWNTNLYFFLFPGSARLRGSGTVSESGVVLSDATFIFRGVSPAEVEDVSKVTRKHPHSDKG